MSFILDALKKLEREKEAREPGVVMVGPVPWGGRDRRRRGPGLAVAGVVLVMVLAGAFLWLRSGSKTPTAGTRDKGTSVPSGETAAAAPEGTGPETARTPPVPPTDRDSRLSESGPTAPPPRDLPPPGEATAPVAQSAAPPTPGLAESTETAGATSRPMDPVAPDEGEPEPAAAEAAPEVFLVEDVVPAAAPPPESEYRLTAISSRDGHPIALLNDRLVREGDRFGDILILRITETSVEIEVNGERRTIGF